MKKTLVRLLDRVLNRIGRESSDYHDDSLRANQPNERGYQFSYWRALVS